MSSATTAYASLVDVPSGCRGRDYVEPGDSSRSYLIDKLTGVGMCSGSRMPRSDAPWPADRIALVRAWIDGGALR